MRPRIHFPALAPGVCQLDSQASHHLVRVLRAAVGEVVVLFDGAGQEAQAQILDLNPQSVTLEVAELVWANRESRIQVTLIQALCSGDKMDWVIEKSTELGVARVIPVAADRSLLRLEGDRAEKRVAHWQRIAQAASAQCGRTRVPQIDAIVKFPQALEAWQAIRPASTGWLLDPSAANSLGTAELPNPLTIMIGPESGWSPQEETLAKAAGALSVQCGPRILRTETAALVVLSAVAVRCGEF
jgi:16S rRNA (uracil1498-N3)-methyltransferase